MMNTILNQRLLLFFLLFALKNVVCGNKIILLEQVRPSIFNVYIFIPIPFLLLDRSLLFYSHVVVALRAQQRWIQNEDDEEAESMTVRVTCTCTHTYASCIPATVTK